MCLPQLALSAATSRTFSLRMASFMVYLVLVFNGDIRHLPFSRSYLQA